MCGRTRALAFQLLVSHIFSEAPDQSKVYRLEHNLNFGGLMYVHLL